MTEPLVPAKQARTPLQQRSQDRFEAVLETARAILAEEGLAGFSIPVVAARLGYTRASIYHFFPTPFAILNELVRRDLESLERSIMDALVAEPTLGWREQIGRAVHAAVEFYAREPIARMLILGGGALTGEGFQALSLTVRHLGAAATRLLGGLARRPLPQLPVDVPTLAVDLGTTCLRQSVLLHGHITPAYEAEAVRVMTQYLALYFEPGEDAAALRRGANE